MQHESDASAKDTHAEFENHPSFGAELRKVRARVDEHRALDSLLREVAVLHVGAQQAQTELATLRRELTVLRAFQQARDLVLPGAASAYAGRRSAHIDAGMALPPAFGMYPMERDGEGHPFRWTGPGRHFRFDVHLDRGVPLKFVLRLAYNSDSRVGTLRAASDGIELPLIRLIKPHSTEFTGFLWPRAVAGLSRVEFSVEQTFTPKDENGNVTDQRELGVAFRNIDFLEATEAEMAALTTPLADGAA
jgi:hypothetical protein